MIFSYPCTTFLHAHTHTHTLSLSLLIVFQLVAFGEAMIRYAPAPTPPGGGDEYNLSHGGAEPFMRSVGGDELNVCVDLAVLNKGHLGPNAAPMVRSQLLLHSVDTKQTAVAQR